MVGYVRCGAIKIWPVNLNSKEGDSAGHVLHAETTDKILLFADNGRFYTLSGDKLPRGRGFGEPVSLMVDLPADSAIVKLVRVSKGKLLVAASTGHGLIVDMQETLWRKHALESRC